MSIQFNPNALSAFSNVNFGRDDAIANLGDGNGLVHNGDRGFGIFAKIRFSSTKANNNAVRTELLRALGQAFNLQGVGEQGGRTTFSQEFMNKLEEILGPDFKRGDFGIDANGEVKSGKPLTQRRIQAVYNAARTYAANVKFQDVSSLLGGAKIADIVGGNLTDAGREGVKQLALLAAKIRDAAQSLEDEGSNVSVEQGNVTVNLALENGRIKASVKIGDAEAKNVENFAKTKDELVQAMNDTISALYDSFPGAVQGERPYGRNAMWDVVDAYEKSMSREDLNTRNDCRLREFAGEILRTKAGVTEAEIGKLTNDDLATLSKKLLNTGDAEGVRNAAAGYVRRNVLMDDLSAFFSGGKIGEITGDKQDAGWKDRAKEFAALAVEVREAAQKMTERGESEWIVHDDFSFKLTWDNGGMKVSLNVGGGRRTVGNLGNSPDELCKAMDDAIAGLCDSPEERAVLAETVLESYKELSDDKMDTTANCPLRRFAVGLLMSKAGLAEDQIKMFTNAELAGLVQKLCEKGDAEEVRNEAKAKHEKASQEVSALLVGRKIAEIVSDKDNPGHASKVKDLAVLAGKINAAAQRLHKKGDTAVAEHLGVKVELAWGEAGITAKTTVGGVTQSVENFAAKPQDVCGAMEGTISALYDSFTERESLDMTLGRSALSGAMNALEMSMSPEDLGSKTDCRLRNFAGGILMSKAGVTKEQVSGLTNGQLSDYVKELCKSGDARAVKDDIAYVTGIKDAPVKDNTVAPVKDDNDAEFRRNAREILVGQVKVPDADFERLTTDEIANFLETLRDTKDPLAVRDAIAMTVEDRAAPK